MAFSDQAEPTLEVILGDEPRVGQRVLEIVPVELGDTASN